MTDELKQRITPEVDADHIVDNPVEELARIMGRTNAPVRPVEPVMAETTTAADLEAELMREFGIDSMGDQSEVPVASHDDVHVPAQSVVDDETLSEAPEQTRFIREPMEQPNYQPASIPDPASNGDDVLAEMAQYSVPDPVESPVETVAAPVDHSAQLGGDDFANDLELELAKLQHGLSDGMSANESVVQSSPVSTNYSQAFHEPFTSAIAEAPVPSAVAESGAPTALTALEIENAVVDMSALINIDNDVEQTIEFDIPSVESASVAAESEVPFDTDLDSELEREFSQMFADEILREDVSDVNTVRPDELVPETEQDDVGSFFDMSAMNEEAPKVSTEPDLDPLLMQPERIDVSQNHANWQDLQAAPGAGGSSTGKFAAVGIFAFLILGAGGYFIYNNLASEGSDSGEPVIIKADNSSIKETPADPGGTSVPNQDLAVYNQVEGNDTSVANQPSLVEATEEPVDIVQRTLDQSLLPLEGREVTDKVEDRLASGNQINEAIADGGARPLIIPKKVRTVVVQSDGTIITREEPAVLRPTQVEPQQAEQSFSNLTASAELADALSAAAAASTGQEVAAVTDNTAQTNVSIATNNQTNTPTNTETAAVAPAVQETQAPVTQPAAQPTENFSGYYMQIASQPSLAAAQSSYQSLAGRYNSILGGRGVEYQKADIEGKGTFHRVRIQVGERSEANSLCSQYKSAGGSCFVTR